MKEPYEVKYPAYPYGSFPEQGGPQYTPPNTKVLIMETPRKGTPNFGKVPYYGKLLRAP